MSVLLLICFARVRYLDTFVQGVGDGSFNASRVPPDEVRPAVSESCTIATRLQSDALIAVMASLRAVELQLSNTLNDFSIVVVTYGLLDLRFRRR